MHSFAVKGPHPSMSSRSSPPELRQPETTPPRRRAGSQASPPGRHRAATGWRPHAVVAVSIFVATVVAANILTAGFGLVPVGFGLTATAGTAAAGVTLLARDWVHDVAGRSA